MELNEVYSEGLDAQERYLLLWGGAGSGKSVFAGQKKLIRLLEETVSPRVDKVRDYRPHNFLVVRKVDKTLRNSCHALINELIIDEGLGKYFLSTVSPMEIRHKTNGNKFTFAGLDNQERLKSIVGITGIWGEEATELTKKDFMQLDLRMRGITKHYKQMILSFNPISALHWLNDVFFVRGRANSRTIHSTYLDNAFIDEDYRTVLEELAGEDENFFNVYARGLWGVLKNIVYKPLRLVSELPSDPDDVYFGLDFGFNNPTSLVKIAELDKRVYLKELIYKTKLNYPDIVEMMRSLDVPRNAPIYCDNAEPRAIKVIRDGGFNAKEADKRSVKAILDYTKKLEVFATEDSSNLQKEWSNYRYKEDKDGNVLEEPVKFLDHAVNAFQYGTYTHNLKRKIKAELF